MAVTRVIGTVDGVEVILNKTEGNRWEVPVPLDEDGEYVVEIMAEDEAGNRSYIAKMLFAVNRALLCVHILRLPFYAELLLGGCQVKMMQPNFWIEVTAEEYVQVEKRRFWIEVLGLECEGV